MSQQPSLCRACHKPLEGIPFGNYYRLVCMNWNCPLHRERQGVIERKEGLKPVSTFLPEPLTGIVPRPRVSPPRGMIRKTRRGRKKTVRRKGLEYARETV
jgi:hypothetical protein